MPRQRSSRPTSRSSAPAQSRSASTLAAPPAAAASRAPPAASAAGGKTAQTASGQPSMLSQMAATAGSVAIGSTLGHGLSNMFFGGSREGDVLPQQDQTAAQNTSQQNAVGKCDVQAKDFTKCIEVADFQSCSYYLEQLKACQAAASQY